MRRWFLFPIVVAACACTTSASMPSPTPSGASLSAPDIAAGIAVVQANENRATAGVLANDTLKVRLVAMPARWYPEAGGAASAEVVAFAEEGKAPQIPAPLIRVQEGTVIVATIRNALPDSTLWMHWLETRPSPERDSVAILPGKTGVIRFDAGAPGTYMYRGTTGGPLAPGVREREQMVGAFVVDKRGDNPDDRVFVINIWSDPPDSVRGLPERKALAINGRSWPFTEALRATTGDTLRWRIVNGSLRGHPMHLHGFYFRVDSRGGMLRDTIYPAGQRRLAVTEEMSPLSTMSMSWVPERPGNGLFHCHLSFHVIASARLDPVKHHTHTADPRQHMAGLVLGIDVRAAADYRAAGRGDARRMSLFVNEGARRRMAPRALSFVEQRGARPPSADSVLLPSSTLVLTRDQPTDITVTNRLREATAVHWHGIELESFSDGVAGWSGDAKRVAPAIAPGKTFTARLTLPRAGTFIYHTHLNDIEQITSGLYGAMIVLEPGERFDPELDHLYVAGWDGDGSSDIMPVVVNGDTTGPARMLRADMPHRLRFINIAPAGRLHYEIRQDTSLVTWRARAKDGADLPAAQATIVPSTRRLDVGETFDATFTPRAGDYTLTVRAGAEIVYRQKLHVR